MRQINRLSRLALRESSGEEESHTTELVSSSRKQVRSQSAALRTAYRLLLIVILGLVFDPLYIRRVTAAEQLENARKAGAARFSVTDYGAKCDDHSDDSLAIETAFRAAARNCRVLGDQSVVNQTAVSLPNAQTCKVNVPLSIVGSCVGIESNGATLDFRSMPVPQGRVVAALTVNSAHPASPYGDNVTVWDGLHLMGPGKATHSIGLLVRTGQAVFQRFNVHGFGVGIQLGDYAFIDSFTHPSIWNVGIGIYCPPGQVDAGENITVEQGAIFNSDVGIDNQGCGMTVSGTSFDGLGGSAIVDATEGGGDLRCSNCYIEYFGPISVPVFQEGACNAWEFIDFQGGQIRSDYTKGANMKALISNNPKTLCGGTGSWAYFNDVFFGNLNPSAKCDAGMGPVCIVGNNAARVRVERSTSGAGGGDMWNLEVR
jgi:hypothetical protein